MNQSNFQRANTLKSAYNACTLEPLKPAEISKYYVDLSAVRKSSAVERVSTTLDFQESGDYTTILFTKAQEDYTEARVNLQKALEIYVEYKDEYWGNIARENLERLPE